MDTENELMNQIKEIEEKRKKEIQTLQKQIRNLTSIHQLSKLDIINIIKQWVYNDINYKKYVITTMKIFSKHQLSGSSVISQPTNNVKIIVQNQLKFITKNTLDIMFNSFDKWKRLEPNSVKSKSAAQIGYILFHYPLNNLLTKINDENIDGKQFMKAIKKQNIIKQSTSWGDEEIYQIESIILAHHTFTSFDFKAHMNKILAQNYNELSKNILNEIKQVVSKLDVEALHFQIKNARNIDEFSDQLINMVDELTENNSDNNVVSKIYEAVADCFVYDYKSDLNYGKLLLERQRWICYNCSNCNVNSFIGSKLNVDLSICSLCGIEKRDSYILALRNRDTFIMVNDKNESKSDEKLDTELYAIETVIETASQHESFDLMCPNINDKKRCPSFVRLAKMLVIYKRWIYTIYKKTKGNDDIEKTVQVDVSKFVNDDTFKIAFVQSAQTIKNISEHDLELLIKLVDDMKSFKTFSKMKRPEFAKYVKKRTKIKPAFAVKLFSKVWQTLKREAQTKQFGQFLSDLDMDIVNKDYYHLLKVHINNGNKVTIKNAMRFFKNVVHFEDTQLEIENCRSAKRREDRVNKLNSYKNIEIKSEQKEKSEKNMWELKQFYNQSQLDMIHSYLVHSQWQYYVQRYSNMSDKNDENDDYKHFQEQKSEELDIKNKQKYMTDLSDSMEATYGFGVDHSHPHLTPYYASMYDELLFNKLYCLTEIGLHHLLVKAIKLHKIALSNEFGKELICKYYNKEFNIIRNNPIGLRHILSIVTFTDMSDFCTKFRQTFRKINNETTEQQVTQRHKQLYYYSRYLFEAIELFGQYMETNLKVFHGLNKLMKFERLTTHFNQPISTTTSLKTAFQFAAGAGIILTLQSATKSFNESIKIPKYMSVSWLSCFPHEDEKLFYGAHVAFQIHNIIEAATGKGHQKELFILNKFQQTVQNHDVLWSIEDNKDTLRMNALIELIHHKLNKQKVDDFKSKYLTKYGQSLFNFFCDNPNTTLIIIQNFKLLPKRLQHALFVEDSKVEHDTDTKTISLIPISKLFRNVREIVLNELDIKPMTANAKDYIDTVLEYLHNTNRSDVKLEKVTIKSKQQLKPKENSTLKKLANRYSTTCDKFDWSIKYEFRIENCHNLVFTNNNIINNISKQNELHNSKPITPSKSITSVKKDVQSSYKYIAKEDTIPSYFIQVTFVDEDDFQVEVVADEPTAYNRKIFLKEIQHNMQSTAPMNTIAIRIEAGKTRGWRYVSIDENHDELYHLALYEHKKSDEPLQNSAQMRLIILKHENVNAMLSNNDNYKPHFIDLSTVFKVKDGKHQKMNVYWEKPSKSFGNISYKIIREENNYYETISSLPYSISFSLLPAKFKVITINKIDDKCYESVPSETIVLESISSSTNPVTNVVVSNDVVHGVEEKEQSSDNIYSQNANELLSFAKKDGISITYKEARNMNVNQTVSTSNDDTTYSEPNEQTSDTIYSFGQNSDAKKFVDNNGEPIQSKPKENEPQLMKQSNSNLTKQFPIVCCNGSRLTRMGRSGTNSPQFSFRSCIGYSLSSNQNVLLIGDEAYNHSEQLKYPLKNELEPQWADLENIWDYSFNISHIYKNSILLSEPTGYGLFNRAKSYELMFEKYGFSSAMMVMNPILTLYAHGLLDGVVLHVSEGVTEITCVQDSYLIPNCQTRSEVAGAQVTDELIYLLRANGYYSTVTKQDFDIFDNLKDEICYCVLNGRDLEAEKRLARETTALTKTYILPDGREIRFNSERFEAMELLFEDGGIHQLLFDTVMKVDIDMRSYMFKHIALSGSVTQLPGFETRIVQELKRLWLHKFAKGNMTQLRKFKVKCDPPSTPDDLYYGASVLADIMKNQPEFWLQKQDYLDKGAKRAVMEHHAQSYHYRITTNVDT